MKYLLPGILLCAVLTGNSFADAKIQRTGWSFDRSHLKWYGEIDQEKLKAAGELRSVAGWTEYDIDIPESGWYELWLQGFPSGWTRTVSVNGTPVLWHSVSTSDDEDKSFKGFKEANLWLEKGRNSLRFHRVTWPGDLPDAWELRPGNGRPEASLRASSVENIVRVGKPQSLTLLGGGTGSAITYDLLARNTQTDETTPVGTIEFPASPRPTEQSTPITFPAEGVYTLIARSGDTTLRPADLKAGTFVAVDTNQAPPPATELKLRPIVDIDCTAEPPTDGFWEKDGTTRVVQAPGGSYRESSGLGTDGDGYWGLDGFSYRVQLPEVDRLYRLRVEYPDDDRRSMGFWMNDGSDPKSNAAAYINTGGVETGDQYPLTHKTQVHEAFFYPQATKDVIVAVINLVPQLKAAASRITIDLVESGLPAAPLGETRGRSMGFYFEESGRWLKFFGATRGGGIQEDLKTLNRWAQWNRYLGANVMFPTINVYQANHYPSKILDGYFSRPINEVRLGTLVAEKYGGEFVPEFHLTGQDWFDREVMGVWMEPAAPGGKEEVRFASPEVEEMILRNRDGGYKHSWEPFMYNALHPRVQDTYIGLIGELADSLADSPAFAGISSRMMFTWQWQGWNALPNLSWGYDDWTIAYFEKETGIKVPGTPGEPTRFRERFQYLTGPERERWEEWRCEKIFAYHQRILARIQKARPGTRLFFNWFGLDPRHAQSTDMLEQMREVGMDWHRYAKEPDIVIIPPGGTYGRRFSTPLADAGKLDTLYDKSIQKAGRFAGRAYGIYSDYFEVNRNLDWAKLGGKPYSAFDANLPSGINERGLYAQALADCDTGFFSNGGSGWIFGTPTILQPFLREYRSLPAVPFDAWDKARDPVAVWSHRDKEGTLWFYAVNRLPVTVEAKIGIEGGTLFPAPGGEEIPLKNGRLNLSLEPYMMRAFRLTGGGSLGDFQVDVPAEFIAKLKPSLDFAREFRTALADRRIAPELNDSESRAAMASIDEALEAFEQGKYHAARGLLERQALVLPYTLSGQFPPGLWERSKNHGNPPLTPIKEQSTVISGEGAVSRITGLTVTEDGHVWIAADGELTEYDPSGKRLRSLSLFAPYDSTVGDIRKTILAPSRQQEVTSVFAAPGDALLIQAGSSAPLLYSTTTARLLPFKNKTFEVPGLPVTILATLPGGTVLVSSSAPGREGVYLFRIDGTLMQKLHSSPARAGGVDANGHYFLADPEAIEVLSGDGKSLGTIAAPGITRMVLTPGGDLIALEEKSNTIRAFKATGPGQYGEAWAFQPPSRVAALGINAAGELLVAFRSPHEGAVAQIYTMKASGPELRSSLANPPSTHAPDGDSALKFFEGKLYYCANGKLMQVTPGNPDIIRPVFDPGFRADQRAFEAFAFAKNGDLYLSSNWNGSKRGINIHRSRRNVDGWEKPEILNNGLPLVEGGTQKTRDLEVDEHDHLILSLANPSARKSLSLYRWKPDGEKELFADLGESPVVDEYGIVRQADASYLVAGGGARKVAKLSPDGAVVWETHAPKSSPPGYTDLRFPIGITADKSGQVWVTDPSRHQVLRLDNSGKLLEVIGEFGGPDGKDTFNRPSGIAAVTDAEGREWLYILDAGNHRLLKWPITK